MCCWLHYSSKVYLQFQNQIHPEACGRLPGGFGLLRFLVLQWKLGQLFRRRNQIAGHLGLVYHQEWLCSSRRQRGQIRRFEAMAFGHRFEGDPTVFAGFDRLLRRLRNQM